MAAVDGDDADADAAVADDDVVVRKDSFTNGSDLSPVIFARVSTLRKL